MNFILNVIFLDILYSLLSCLSPVSCEDCLNIAQPSGSSVFLNWVENLGHDSAIMRTQEQGPTRHFSLTIFCVAPWWLMCDLFNIVLLRCNNGTRTASVTVCCTRLKAVTANSVFGCSPYLWMFFVISLYDLHVNNLIPWWAIVENFYR